MPKKKSVRLLNFEEEEDEEMEPELDHELFGELTEELDEAIEKSMERTYNDTLNTFNRILKNPSKSSEHRVPTLFLCGHCLDWNWLFNRLRKCHKHLTIKNKEFAEVSEELTTDSENESGDHLKKGGGKVILFFQDNSFSKREVFERILSLIGKNVFVLLLVHTPISFSSIDERIPRLFFVQMSIINSMHLPPVDHFLHALFIKNWAFLPRANVQFHGKTVQFIQQMFRREHRTLKSVRKGLTFALFDYVRENGGEKRPKTEERKEFANVTKTYFASLRALVLLTDQNNSLNSEEFALKLHFQIQNSQEKFTEFYTNLKSKCENWTIDKWQNKMERIGEIIMDKNNKDKCREFAVKLDEQRNRSQNEQSENIEPPKQTSVHRTSFKRSVKTSKIFADQRLLRNRLISPLDVQFRAELFQFLDSLFLPNLLPFPNKFVAGPGDLALLDPSLSVELDRCFSEQSNAIKQLDIVNVYQLLVSHSSDYYTFPLSTLQEAFCLLAKPIEGLEKEARFLSAIAQLENIGVVKSLPNDFVRLIYLTRAILK
ncbi:hypothetical protein niasHT_039764 [Heterodera trifolii]|uniref:Origin recognition complex subunit 3 n=1 Tax=Heterodera trifolii TaxID=157864 RepID=A0ABD2IT42_9BILA